MLSDADLYGLAEAMSRSGINRIEIEGPGERLALKVSPAVTLPSGLGEPSHSMTFSTVASPSMGIFHRVHPDGLFPPCREGSGVGAGQIIAFLQVDQLLLPVQAPGPGRVAAVLVAEGSLVGYGDPLFTIES